MSSEKMENLVFIRSLVEAGIIKSIIDKRYPLERTADAHRYVEEGNKKGSVVLTLEHNDNGI